MLLVYNNCNIHWLVLSDPGSFHRSLGSHDTSIPQRNGTLEFHDPHQGVGVLFGEEDAGQKSRGRQGTFSHHQVCHCNIDLTNLLCIDVSCI